VDALETSLLGVPAMATVRGATDDTITIMLALVSTLTLLLASVSALGVFNTVILNTRDQMHEIGVLKAIGTTPHQVRTMVMSTVTGIGLLAGVLAVLVGLVLHHEILPIMASAA
jgi:putative ABC transport system permease protein